ncbi:MAG: MBOAT family protein [Acetatifactor sp.]|nr:MBOAT family protein [Acetatifactor sp.]
MVFSSAIFLFRFLPIFLICYFLVPRRVKNFILFLGSLIFYAWGEPIYVLLMLFSTVVDYCLGRLIDANRDKAVSKVFLAMSVLTNLSLLCVFKYLEFLPLPIGISFYTFQTMSYTIDVYRGETKVQRNLLDFGVYVAMFPQLIAGPIVKYKQVEQDLHERPVDLPQISYGTKRFVTGLAKKVLIANNVGELWSMISASNIESLSVLTAWMGIIAFAFQIYFDFSGYSDMAIGLGAILGFHLPENFKYPYIATSITDFWRRWHISLGSWFRDYVYIPLGGNRKGLKIQIVNILIVWMLTGIWHGAGLNFLFWGLWFAGFLILEKMGFGRVLEAMPVFFSRLYTWLVVLLGWVCFSLETPGAILSYLGAMFGVNSTGVFDRQGLYLGREYLILLLIAAVTSTPLIMGLVRKLKNVRMGWSLAIYRLGEKLIPPILLLVSVAYVVAASYNPFLYFRF